MSNKLLVKSVFVEKKMKISVKSLEFMYVQSTFIS